MEGATTGCALANRPTVTMVAPTVASAPLVTATATEALTTENSIPVKFEPQVTTAVSVKDNRSAWAQHRTDPDEIVYQWY